MIAFDDLQTFGIGLLALVAVNLVVRRVPLLARINVPIPVIGGVLIAIGVALLHGVADISIQFASTFTNFLLLVFFTTIGLSAKLASLKAGGRPLVILCVAIMILLVAQNVVGLAVAWAVGAHPMYGLLIGSVSFTGGAGTAAAWGQEAKAMGLENAPEIAAATATLALVVWATVSGPVTDWLVRRWALRGPVGATPASWADPEVGEEAADDGVLAPEAPIASVMIVLLLIVGAVLAGDAVNQWARSAGVVLPGFLTAMLAGTVITNIADPIGARIDMAPINRGGEIALQSFLVMYLMSLKLWTLEPAIWPLLATLAIQITVTLLIGILLLYRWLGRDYDAAVTVGGFLGFGLSSMAIAMATMDGVAQRHGPSPKAFLLVALAGAFFVDIANAFVVKAFLMLPWLQV